VAKIQYTTLSFIKIEEMREKRILFGLILCHVTWSIQGQTAAIREIKLEDIGDNFESSIPIQKLVPGSYVNFLVDLKLPQSNNYENIFRTKFTHNQKIDKVHRSVYYIYCIYQDIYYILYISRLKYDRINIYFRGIGPISIYSYQVNINETSINFNIETEKLDNCVIRITAKGKYSVNLNYDSFNYDSCISLLNTE